jgi:hypothetical protein
MGNNINTNLRNSMFAGICFGAAMGLLFSWLCNPAIGSGSGVIAGLLFGLLVYIFIQRMTKKFKNIPPSNLANETIVFEGPANHFRGVESVGGYLYLGSGGLVFESHKLNVQKHKLVIPLPDILEVKPALTLGIVPNGMLIITKNNDRERFVVNNRRQWIAAIQKAISHIESADVLELS